MEEELQTTFRVEQELPFLDPLVSEWFNQKYSGLSEPQKKAIPLIHSGSSVLVSSPTGTGKTLSAFLAIINELFIRSREDRLGESVFCLYISPLKALANDIDRNLREPLNEIYELAKSKGMDFPQIRVGVRSGDTSQNERQKMLRKPPHILITTPESFTLSLTAPKFREHLKSIKYVIIDEIHEISANKRGTLLSANLERLESLTGKLIRVGLSATQAPLDLIGGYLCGYDNGAPRNVTIIEADTKKSLDLKVLTPVEDLTKVSYEVANEKMYDILTDLIKKHRTTLIFTNTRSGTEHVAIRLKARGIESIEAHHSSLGKETRMDVESRLKNGELQCVITSTSLELGIDIGYIDLVIQIGSPKSVSKGLQRIGRSGHGLDVLSIGRFVVFELDDLIECAVLTKAAYDHEIDKVTIPTNSLDVLSQVLVGMSLEKAWGVDEAFEVLTRSFSYHLLDKEDYMNTLKYLAGQVEDQTIYSKIWYDPEEGRFGKKRSSRMIFFMNVGTIPEEADYQVITESGRHLGQLSDKFVERLKPGDVFVLGAKIHMFLSTRRNRVIVKDATGMRPTVPSWTGEMLPRSYDLGVLVGKFREEVSERLDAGEDVEDWLIRDYRLEKSGARSIVSYIRAQKKFGLPTDSKLLVEGYVDNGKLFNSIYHIPLGRRVNDALSRGIAQAVTRAYSVNVRITITDDGFMLTTQQKIPLQGQVDLLRNSNFSELVRKSIINTEVFKQRFRHCATRSLMVLRKYKGYDISVVRQQLRSDKVLRVLGEMESFPVIKETYHEIMNDMMDVPRAQGYVDNVILKGQFTLNNYSNESSPFSYGLILAGISDIVLMEDRSKLLKELQGKILDRIYTSDSISFIFRDLKAVENYFMNKVPKISDPANLNDFFKHFMTVDPFKARFNSPYSYTREDIKETIEKAIYDDALVSAYLRSPQWCSIEHYGLIKSVFERPAELNEEEQEIYQLCDSNTLREIRSLSGYEDSMVRTTVQKLESSYMIRRKLKGGQVCYIRNDMVTSSLDRGQSIRQLLLLLIGSMGPLTLDEIMIRLPTQQEEIETQLDQLVSSNSLAFDYITPVFSKQYILRSDLDSLVSGGAKDLHSTRLQVGSGEVANLIEYFEQYGFSTDEWSYLSRCVSFSRDELDTLKATGQIVQGRIIRHKDSLVAPWLLEALHSLRYDSPDKNMLGILRLVESGVKEEKEIIEASGMDRQVVKQLLKSAEFLCLIGRDSPGHYNVLMGSAEPIGKNIAINRLIEKFGPVSLNELANSFWFYTTELENFIEAERSYLDGEVLFGKQKAAEGKNGIIISDSDPLSIYLRRDLRNSEFGYHYINNGKLSGSFDMTMKEDSLILTGGHLTENSEPDFLLTIFKKLVEQEKFSTIVYENAPAELLESARQAKIRTTDTSFSIGEISVLDLGIENLLQYAFYKEAKGRASTENIYDMLRGSLFGFTGEVDAIYSGIPQLQLNGYLKSRALYTFKGPFSMNVVGTLDSASVYRTFREKTLSENDQRILRLVMETSGITEKDIIMNLRTNIFGISSTLKSLYSRSIIAKDSYRRFVFVPEKFKKREAFTLAIRGLLDRFGFIDWQRFSRFSGSNDQDTFEALIRTFLKAGRIRKSAMHGGSKIVYATNDLINFSRKQIPIRVLTPKELISSYLQDLIRSSFGSGNIYIAFQKSGLVAFKSRSTRNGRKLLQSITKEPVSGELHKELYRLRFDLSE